MPCIKQTKIFIIFFFFAIYVHDTAHICIIILYGKTFLLPFVHGSWVYYQKQGGDTIHLVPNFLVPASKQLLIAYTRVACIRAQFQRRLRKIRDCTGPGNALTQFRNSNEKTMGGTLIYGKHPTRGLERRRGVGWRDETTLRTNFVLPFFFGTVSWKWPSLLFESLFPFERPFAYFAPVPLYGTRDGDVSFSFLSFF